MVRRRRYGRCWLPRRRRSAPPPPQCCCRPRLPHRPPPRRRPPRCFYQRRQPRRQPPPRPLPPPPPRPRPPPRRSLRLRSRPCRFGTVDNCQVAAHVNEQFPPIRSRLALGRECQVRGRKCHYSELRGAAVVVRGKGSWYFQSFMHRLLDAEDRVTSAIYRSCRRRRQAPPPRWQPQWQSAPHL